MSASKNPRVPPSREKVTPSEKWTTVGVPEEIAREIEEAALPYEPKHATIHRGMVALKKGGA